MQHNSIQYKIDSFIKDANDKISIAKRNEIGALVSYSQALDLFDFLDKPYSIQYHEINVKENMKNSDSIFHFYQKLQHVLIL